ERQRREVRVDPGPRGHAVAEDVDAAHAELARHVEIDVEVGVAFADQIERGDAGGHEATEPWQPARPWAPTFLQRAHLHGAGLSRRLAGSDRGAKRITFVAGAVRVL